MSTGRDSDRQSYSLLVPQITLVINSARPYPLYNPPIQGKILP